MDNFFLLVIAVLFILLAGFLIFYFQTQQSFQEITQKLEEIQQQLNQEFKGKTDLTYFGSSFIAVANAKQIKQDIMTTVFISLSLLVLVLVFFYRNILVPIIIFIPFFNNSSKKNSCGI